MCKQINHPNNIILNQHLVLINKNNPKWQEVNTVRYLYLDNDSYLLYTVWERADVNSNWIYIGLNKHVPYNDTTFIPYLPTPSQNLI